MNDPHTLYSPGTHKNKSLLFSRVVLAPSNVDLPYVLCHCQFVLHVVWANQKSSGMDTYQSGYLPWRDCVHPQTVIQCTKPSLTLGGNDSNFTSRKTWWHELRTTLCFKKCCDTPFMNLFACACACRHVCVYMYMLECAYFHLHVHVSVWYCKFNFVSSCHIWYLQHLGMFLALVCLSPWCVLSLGMFLALACFCALGTRMVFICFRPLFVLGLGGALVSSSLSELPFRPGRAVLGCLLRPWPLLGLPLFTAFAKLVFALDLYEALGSWPLLGFLLFFTSVGPWVDRTIHVSTHTGKTPSNVPPRGACGNSSC